MSTVKDLSEELKDLNEHDNEISKDFDAFLKDTKHAMLTLGKSIQELADLEEEMKDPKKSVDDIVEGQDAVTTRTSARGRETCGRIDYW